jgi:hypothetical protein
MSVNAAEKPRDYDDPFSWEVGEYNNLDVEGHVIENVLQAGFFTTHDDHELKVHLDDLKGDVMPYARTPEKIAVRHVAGAMTAGVSTWVKFPAKCWGYAIRSNALLAVSSGGGKLPTTGTQLSAALDSVSIGTLLAGATYRFIRAHGEDGVFIDSETNTQVQISFYFGDIETKDLINWL